MGELQRIGAIADRRERVEQLRMYAHSHAHDPDGWYMLHLELERAGERGASEVARRRALAINWRVPERFTEPLQPPQTLPSGELDVPGYRVVRKIYASNSARLYEAIDPASTRCMLRILLGGSTESLARMIEHQRLVTAYPRCVPISQIVKAHDGTPVQVLPWSDALPVDAEGGRLPDPDGARKAIAAIAGILAAPHRDGLIAGDLRPSTVLGKIDQPDSLRLLGLRRAIDGSFGTIAADDERFLWYATEEGAERLDARTDIYGLGLLLWWIVDGRQPPPLGQRLKDRMPPTGDAELDRIVARCTQAQPDDRYACVDDLIRDLVQLEAPHAGPWLLGDRVGGGTAADVYKATHATDRREAFVKLFTHRLNHERERAALAAAAAVPGVVQELDASPPDAEPRYLATSPAPGESLAQLLSRGPIAPPLATAIFRRLVEIIAKLHEAGVIHRDLCPASIFVTFAEPTATPEVTVIDLDAAKLRARPELDEPHLIGTPAYMAPEQWELVPDVDERADIYALGLVFFESITGLHALTGDSLISWQRAHLEPARPPLGHHGIPPHHAALIEAMISRDRARRPGTMRDVLAVLEAPAPDPHPDPGHRDPDDVRPPWWKRWPRDRRVQLAAGGVAAVIVGAIALWKLVPWNSPPTIPRLDVGTGTAELGAQLSMRCVASDPDRDPLSYAWQTSLGEIVGTGEAVALVARVAGDAEVRCTVDDGAGHFAAAIAHVAVRDHRSPTAAFEHAIIGSTSTSVRVRFDNRTTGSRDDIQWRWDFGDGAASTEESPTHEFACTDRQRSFTVALRASNRYAPRGHQVTRPNLVSVTPPPPPPARVKATAVQGCRGRCEAWFAVSSSTGAAPVLECEAPCQVRFEDSSAGIPRQICWRPEFGAPATCGNLRSTEHVYASPRDHLATRSATYECGETSTAALSVRVSAPPPRPSGRFVSSFHDLSRRWPANVTFRYSPGDGEGPFVAASTFDWSFGDGSRSPDRNVAHRFVNPGVYRVTLTVTNPRGERATTSQDLTVLGRVGERVGTIGPFWTGPSASLTSAQGTWGSWAYCPPGQLTYQLSKQIEPLVVSRDNTTLNSIKLDCVIPGTTPTFTNTAVSSKEGRWSGSLTSQRCQGASYVRGARLRLDLRPSSDRMGATDVQLLCQDGRTLAGGLVVDRGDWMPWQQCMLPGGRLPDGSLPLDPARPPVAICGIRTRVQDPQGMGDDTALNDVELACCYSQ